MVCARLFMRVVTHMRMRCEPHPAANQHVCVLCALLMCRHVLTVPSRRVSVPHLQIRCDAMLWDSMGWDEVG